MVPGISMSWTYWRHSGRRASAQQGPPGPGHPEQRLPPPRSGHPRRRDRRRPRAASGRLRLRPAASEHRKRAETALITVDADCRPAGVSRRRMAPRTHTARTSRPGPGSSRPRASASRPSPGSPGRRPAWTSTFGRLRHRLRDKAGPAREERGRRVTTFEEGRIEPARPGHAVPTRSGRYL